MNAFLKISIGCCVFILLYAVMIMSNPDAPIFNWIISTICGGCISVGLLTSNTNKS